MNSKKLWIYSIVVRFLPETRFFGIKVALLRWCGAVVGKNVRVNSRARFCGTSSLTIGDDVWLGAFTSISASAPVVIGSHVDMDAIITTGGHKIDPVGSHVAGEGRSAAVVIGDGCWLCIRSMILSGVTVGANSVVAAGAVVTKDVPSRVLVAGVPARVKKAIQ